MSKKIAENNDIRILLHDVRSAHNVGSIFRTGEAIGVSRFYLTGYTPLPLDKFGRVIKEIAKTALGAEKSIAWEYAETPRKIIGELRKQGFEIVGLEQDARAIDYKNYVAQRRTLVLVGSEVAGMSAEFRNECDALLEIPMQGMKESLNVSVAFGIALFRLFDSK